MSARYPPLRLHVWGDLACFTRPDQKVERVSYAMMTPSAARGMLEAIFWKPEFRWRVEEIWLLKPIRYQSFVRNEVNSRVTVRSARQWSLQGGGFFAPEDRAQRHTLALRDVAYVISAQIDLKPHTLDDVAKYRDQFRRRVARGQCFATPYFGCREFSAAFAEPSDTDIPLDYSSDLGLMVWDLDYDSHGAQPTFFQAAIQHGILRVPARTELEVNSAAPAT